MICPCAELPWVATRGQLLAFLILNYEKVNGHSWVGTEGNSALGQIIVKIYYLIQSHEKAFAIQTADWLRNWARSDPHEFHVRCLIEPKMCFPRLSIPKTFSRLLISKTFVSFCDSLHGLPNSKFQFLNFLTDPDVQILIAK